MIFGSFPRQIKCHRLGSVLPKAFAAPGLRRNFPLPNPPYLRTRVLDSSMDKKLYAASMAARTRLDYLRDFLDPAGLSGTELPSVKQA